MPFRRFRNSKGKKLNKKQVTQVKRIISHQQEHNFYATKSTGTDVTNAATIVDLFAPTQGNAEGTRDGDVVKYKWFDYNIMIRRKSTSTAGERDAIRLSIVQWKPNSGQDGLGAGEIWEDTASVSFLANLDQDKRGLFNVLYDMVIPLGPKDTGNGGVKTLRLKRSFANLRKTCQFDAGTTAGQNKIYMVFIGTNSGVEASEIIYQGMIKYTDS